MQFFTHYCAIRREKPFGYGRGFLKNYADKTQRSLPFLHDLLKQIVRVPKEFEKANYALLPLKCRLDRGNCQRFPNSESGD